MLTKVCTRCHAEKERSEFRKHPSFADGLNSACKACLGAADKARYEKNREKILEQQKDYVTRQKESAPEDFKRRRHEAAVRYRSSPQNTVTERYLRDRYGLTLEKYEAMKAEQEERCKICRRPPGGRWKTLHVDHDHATGRVRGLLCFDCNIMLGFARDQPGVLQQAIRYLSLPQEPDLESFDPSI